jgi:hypothetical protein
VTAERNRSIAPVTSVMIPGSILPILTSLPRTGSFALIRSRRVNTPAPNTIFPATLTEMATLIRATYIYSRLNGLNIENAM